MSSTALSATNKIESNKIVRKNKIIYKKCTNNTKLLTKYIGIENYRKTVDVISCLCYDN